MKLIISIIIIIFIIILFFILFRPKKIKGGSYDYNKFLTSNGNDLVIENELTISNVYGDEVTLEFDDAFENSDALFYHVKTITNSDPRQLYINNYSEYDYTEMYEYLNSVIDIYNSPEEFDDETGFGHYSRTINKYQDLSNIKAEINELDLELYAGDTLHYNYLMKLLYYKHEKIAREKTIEEINDEIENDTTEDIFSSLFTTYEGIPYLQIQDNHLHSSKHLINKYDGVIHDILLNNLKHNMKYILFYYTSLIDLNNLPEVYNEIKKLFENHTHYKTISKLIIGDEIEFNDFGLILNTTKQEDIIEKYNNELKNNKTIIEQCTNISTLSITQKQLVLSSYITKLFDCDCDVSLDKLQNDLPRYDIDKESFKQKFIIELTGPVIKGMIYNYMLLINFMLMAKVGNYEVIKFIEESIHIRNTQKNDFMLNFEKLTTLDSIMISLKNYINKLSFDDYLIDICSSDIRDDRTNTTIFRQYIEGIELTDEEKNLVLLFNNDENYEDTNGIYDNLLMEVPLLNYVDDHKYNDTILLYLYNKLYHYIYRSLYTVDKYDFNKPLIMNTKLTEDELYLYAYLFYILRNNYNGTEIFNIVCELILSIHNYKPGKDYTNESIEIYGRLIELERLIIDNSFDSVLNDYDFSSRTEKQYNDEYKVLFVIVLSSYYCNKSLVSTMELYEDIIKNYITNLSEEYKNINEYYRYSDPIENPNKTITDKTLLKINMSKLEAQRLYSLSSLFNTIDMDAVTFYKLFRYPFLHNNEPDYKNEINENINMFNVLYVFNGGNVHGKTYEKWLRKVYEY